MNKLFEILNPESNDELNKMSGLELQEVLYYLSYYYLELRKVLGIDEYITFGLELEFENAMRECINSRLKKANISEDWIFKNDRSLTLGAEINSPKLKDTPLAWDELKTVCKIVKKDAIIGPNSAGHIHVGAQILGDKTNTLLNLILLWSVYENIIFRSSYGEYLNSRPSLFKYAKSMSKDFLKEYEQLKTYDDLNIYLIMNRLKYERKQAINFQNIKNLNKELTGNTIEFRCPNGTLNPIIWQNNVNFFVHLLLYCKSDKFNYDIIEERRRINMKLCPSVNYYNEIYLEQALELCDMIFNTNLDKIYFLRQYLKSFQVSNKPLKKARRFTANF